MTTVVDEGIPKSTAVVAEEVTTTMAKVNKSKQAHVQFFDCLLLLCLIIILPTFSTPLVQPPRLVPRKLVR